MAYWKEIPYKESLTQPTGIKSNVAILDYPINFSIWLSNNGATYVSHSVKSTGSIKIDSSMYNAGIITCIISGGIIGDKTSFTVNIVADKLGTILKDTRTFYLDIVSR